MPTKKEYSKNVTIKPGKGRLPICRDPDNPLRLCSALMDSIKNLKDNDLSKSEDTHGICDSLSTTQSKPEQNKKSLPQPHHRRFNNRKAVNVDSLQIKNDTESATSVPEKADIYRSSTENGGDKAPTKQSTAFLKTEIDMFARDLCQQNGLLRLVLNSDRLPEPELVAQALLDAFESDGFAPDDSQYVDADNDGSTPQHSTTSEHVRGSEMDDDFSTPTKDSYSRVPHMVEPDVLKVFSKCIDREVSHPENEMADERITLNILVRDGSQETRESQKYSHGMRSASTEDSMNSESITSEAEACQPEIDSVDQGVHRCPNEETKQSNICLLPPLPQPSPQRSHRRRPRTVFSRLTSLWRSGSNNNNNNNSNE